MSKNLIVGTLILIFQVVLLIYYRGQEEKYFCWAPHDEQSLYTVEVTIENRKLSDREASKRYRLRTQLFWADDHWEWRHIESRSIGNVKGIITQYESTYGKDDHARVKLIYQVNGDQQQYWHWPK